MKCGKGKTPVDGRCVKGEKFIRVEMLGEYDIDPRTYIVPYKHIDYLLEVNDYNAEGGVPAKKFNELGRLVSKVGLKGKKEDNVRLGDIIESFEFNLEGY